MTSFNIEMLKFSHCFFVGTVFAKDISVAQGCLRNNVDTS